MRNRVFYIVRSLHSFSGVAKNECSQAIFELENPPFPESGTTRICTLLSNADIPELHAVPMDTMLCNGERSQDREVMRRQTLAVGFDRTPYSRERTAMVNLRTKALEVLRYLPRVALNNLKDVPHSNWVKKKKIMGYRREVRWPHKGQLQRQHYAALGFAGGNSKFHLAPPREPYYKDHHLRRHYPPLSLENLQLMVDTGRIDPSRPIDLTTICNTHLFSCDTLARQFGVHLTADGIDKFQAKLNIEVQYAKEPVIAAIERCGGVITTAHYDILCVEAKINPEKFLKRGLPIPRRELPPEDAFEYYSDPKNRGYLADPKAIAEERLKLAQKYGYELPDLSKDPAFAMLTYRKDPRQVYDGLRPGWLVNLKDKIVLRPTDPEYIRYYET